MSRFFLFFCIVGSLILTGCSNKKNNLSVDNVETKISNIWVFDSLALDQRIGGVHPDSINSGMKVDLLLEYPTSAPDSINLTKIQQIISYAFLGSDSIKTTIDEVFNIQSRRFVDVALDEVKAWKEWNSKTDLVTDLSDYYDSRSTKIDTIIDNFMIISTTSYSYLGGAHGAYYIQYTNIDLSKAEILTNDMLYNKNYKENLAEIIQSKIKERNKSTNPENHIYLLAKLEDISPNENFYLSEKGITYVYNQYEITPYAQGIVEILLPYGEILPLIKNKYLLPIENLINSSKSN